MWGHQRKKLVGQPCHRGVGRPPYGGPKACVAFHRLQHLPSELRLVPQVIGGVDRPTLLAKLSRFSLTDLLHDLHVLAILDIHLRRFKWRLHPRVEK